jgi:hypothetical protein
VPEIGHYGWYIKKGNFHNIIKIIVFLAFTKRTFLLFSQDDYRGKNINIITLYYMQELTKIRMSKLKRAGANYIRKFFCILSLCQPVLSL